MGLPKDGEQGCLFVQKTEFSVFGLILSCHPILQEVEFSVVRININPLSVEKLKPWENLHFKGHSWLWKWGKHILMKIPNFSCPDENT